MKWHICRDAEATALECAACIAGLAREAVAARGQFLLAVSGGETPKSMFIRLAQQAMPWSQTHVFQVDERVVPAGNADRNLTTLQADLLARVPLMPQQMHSMPVEERHLSAAARGYAETLQQWCGSPPVLDLIHLGLGGDGHTASLVPGDPVLNVMDREVAVTGMYKGRRRMTLTYPAINRARRILWLVTGTAKAPILARLRQGDAHIPAGAIEPENAEVFTDRDAAGVQT
ncbi:MAG: 6-phosphogluconolactonase [Gammaproteobacteria bacterium]|nr:6-phosphogluconolactonase [Gammaproteobacteria bacterium]MDE2345766.1 6-phosphogluconolactonase [Gammaproteobacteria bacterium]